MYLINIDAVLKKINVLILLGNGSFPVVTEDENIVMVFLAVYYVIY